MDPREPLVTVETTRRTPAAPAAPSPDVRPGWVRRLVGLLMAWSMAAPSVALALVVFGSSFDAPAEATTSGVWEFGPLLPQESTVLLLLSLWPTAPAWLAALVLVIVAGTWTPLRATAALTSPVWVLVGGLLAVALPLGLILYVVAVAMGAVALWWGLQRDTVHAPGSPA